MTDALSAPGGTVHGGPPTPRFASTTPPTCRRTRPPRPLPAVHVTAPKEHGHG
jgi:hypothetical protein